MTGQLQIELPFTDERWRRLFEGANQKLVDKFLKYHKRNPDLYNLFKKFAAQALAAGRTKFSAWMIFNRIRWYTQIETDGKEFKITNDYIALYTRFMVWESPEFEGFFTLKAMKPNRKEPKE